MATTKRKSGRNARKTAAKKTSSTRAARDEGAESTSTTSRGTVADGTGLDAKQQSALERGGSLAQRNDSESRIGPEADAPTEITSAAPPNVPELDEPGRASSPSFDEQPVTGKGKTGAKDAPRGQKVKAGEGEAADEGKVKDIHKLEDLPPGTTVEFRADAVTIHAAIAGGGRTFIGNGAGKQGVRHALAQFNSFAENGPELFDEGLSDEEKKNRDTLLKQSEAQALERSKEDLKRRGIDAD